MVRARAAEIILQPVSASGNHTIQGTEIRLESGSQRVRFEFQFRGFSPNMLKTYQGKLDSSGYNNGGSSVELHAADVVCPSLDNAGNLFCRNAFAETGIGAPRCIDADYGPGVELRCEAAWINHSRTDWIMFGHASLAAVYISSPNYRWGGTTYPGEEVIDEALTYYAGTLMVEVPADAVGSYTIGWDDHETQSLLQTAQGVNITPLVLIAATITVPCTSNDQCAPFQCREAVCDKLSGECVPKPDGTSCTDCNECTGGDQCQSGTCVAGPPVICSGVDQCTHSTFDAETGECSPPQARQNFTDCDDFNFCTYFESCSAGTCRGGFLREDGTACDDNDACTSGDRCVAGVCLRLSTVVCTNGNACNDAGSCNPESGACSAPTLKPDGTACDDGDLCTANQCEQGVCEAAEIPDCVQWQDMFDCVQGPDSPKEHDCDEFDLNGDGFVDMLDVTLLLETY